MRCVPRPPQQPAHPGLTPLKWLRFLAFPLVLLGGLAAAGAILAGLVIGSGLAGGPSAVAAEAAAAHLTSTFTLANEYDFRGISQSGKKPAAQFSLDFASDNGFAASVWMSNIDYGPDASEDREIDLSLGYSKEILPDLSLDVGSEDEVTATAIGELPHQLLDLIHRDAPVSLRLD